MFAEEGVGALGLTRNQVWTIFQIDFVADPGTFNDRVRLRTLAITRVAVLPVDECITIPAEVRRFAGNLSRNLLRGSPEAVDKVVLEGISKFGLF